MIDMNRRSFTLGGAVAALTISKALGAQPSARDALWFVNPELRPAAKQMMAMQAKMPPFSKAGLPAARQMRFSPPPLATVPYSKRFIPVPGEPDVAIYIINAKPGNRRAGILHTHGGGFISGSAESSIHDLQGLATRLDCAIVTVEYRLAPESTWAGSLEDNYAGLRWLRDHAEELGVDVERIAVMGESAGGGHAALLAIAARDRRDVSVAFQCLTYPMLDDRTGSTRMPPAPIGTVGWDSKANSFGWASFLGRAPGAQRSAPGGIPARTTSLVGLPPAWIGVGSIDLFVDEDLEYSQRLINSLVPTEVAVVPGAFHGFDVIAGDTSIAKAFIEARTAALRRALNT